MHKIKNYFIIKSIKYSGFNTDVKIFSKKIKKF